MRSRGLASILTALALLGAAGPARASGPLPASEAKAALDRLEASLAPLSRDYVPRDRKPVLALLEDLQARVAALRPAAGAPAPRAAQWEKLSRGADAALRREREFWALQAAAPAARLPAPTAEALIGDVRRLTGDFGELYAPPTAAGGADPRSVGSGEAPRSAVASVASASRAGTQAAEHPELFFDGGAGRGVVAGPPAGTRGSSSAAPTRPSAPAPTKSAGVLPVEPVQHLRTDADVPAPSRRPASRRRTRTERVVSAVRTVSPAMRRAARTTPVIGPALSRASTKPAAPRPSGDEAACRRIVGDGALGAYCGRGWVLSRGATLAAGVGDAFREQFGSALGVASFLLPLVMGVALGAMSGGLSALTTILLGLCSLALVATILALAAEAASALKRVWATRDDDPAHWRALRDGGKVIGQLILLGISLALGYGGLRLGRFAANGGLRGAASAITSRFGALLNRGGASSSGLSSALAADLEGGAARGGSRSTIRPPEPPPEEAPATPAPGRSLADPESLRGAAPDEVKALIPKDWIQRPMRTGRGAIYERPGSRGSDIVQISRGNPDAPDALHRGAYVKISRSGKTVRVELKSP